MNERDEIERLVDEYGTEKACCGRFAVAAKIALMSAIDRVLADAAAKTKRMWELGHECDHLQACLAERDARIAALEKALLEVEERGHLYSMYADSTFAQFASAALAQPEEKP